MSIKNKLTNISYEEKVKICKDLSFIKKQSTFTTQVYPDAINAYDVEEDCLFTPFKYKLENYKRPLRDTFPPANMKFSGTLRPLQEEVKSEAIKLLNKTGSCILAMYTGSGKTFTSIYIACKIKLKTLIIINRVILIKQWLETIEKASPLSEVQILHSKTKINEHADFYIINALNMYKKGREFFKNIGCVIADEIHLLATKVLSRCFFYVYPRYLIGLSATPHRSDGMNDLLYAFFGKNIIFRKLQRLHYIYKVKTGFKPEYTIAKSGKIDWNSLLNWQATCEKRNQLIVKLVNDFPNRVFLILCKRVIQVKNLVASFDPDEVTSLVGSQKEFNVNARILIGTVQKCGVGFDHPRLNSLIIASDLLEYYIQYLGRVFRTEEVIPYIFDIVDDHGILEKHYLKRRKVYKNHGGVIKRKKLL